MSRYEIVNCNIHNRRDSGSCQRCDEERVGLTYFRAFRVGLVVPQRWLTADSEYSEEEGWKELADQIQRHIQRFPTLDGLRVDFWEWDRDAELEAR